MFHSLLKKNFLFHSFLLLESYAVAGTTTNRKKGKKIGPKFIVGMKDEEKLFPSHYRKQEIILSMFKNLSSSLTRSRNYLHSSNTPEKESMFTK
jgi:hypothetical protein